MSKSAIVLFSFGVLCLCLERTEVHAANPEVAVGTARTRKTVIAIPAPRAGENASAYSPEILDTIKSDLQFMDLFAIMRPEAFIENAAQSGIAPGTFKVSDWTSIGAEVLVKSALEKTQNGLTYEVHVYQTGTAKELFAKRYLGTAQEGRLIAHTAAGDIVEALTGLPSIFSSKIIMACERGGKKEIFMTDFDGTNVRQITSHRSLALAPNWSPDGRKMVYSLYVKGRDNVKNVNLYEFDFHTRLLKLLSNRQGINSGAAYSPDGKKIALTMSFLGNSEIFTLDPTSGNVVRLTKSVGVDVDPNWSPDGREIVFVSSRSGKSMIWKMAADGSSPQRLTYAGDYNAAPSWSPRNNKIAFAGWVDGRFDIFIMNPDGTNIERLTKNQGNNEDPSFSPDGQFVTFSSNRTGQANVYVMNLDGTSIKRLTYGLGNCVAPKWSTAGIKGVTLNK